MCRWQDKGYSYAKIATRAQREFDIVGNVSDATVRTLVHRERTRKSTRRPSTDLPGTSADYRRQMRDLTQTEKDTLVRWRAEGMDKQTLADRATSLLGRSITSQGAVSAINKELRRRRLEREGGTTTAGNRSFQTLRERSASPLRTHQRASSREMIESSGLKMRERQRSTTLDTSGRHVPQTRTRTYSTSSHVSSRKLQVPRDTYCASSSRHGSQQDMFHYPSTRPTYDLQSTRTSQTYTRSPQTSTRRYSTVMPYQSSRDTSTRPFDSHGNRQGSTSYIDPRLLDTRRDTSISYSSSRQTQTRRGSSVSYPSPWPSQSRRDMIEFPDAPDLDHYSSQW